MLGVPEAMAVDRCFYEVIGTMNSRPVYKIITYIVVFRASKGGLWNHENKLVYHPEICQFNTSCSLHLK